MPALDLTTSSPDETRALGRAVAGLLREGDVVSLTGDLGAGKTTFVQGAAAGLGVEQHVLSPTFNLVREYEGRWCVYHVDVYRLDRLQDVVDLGMGEMLDSGGVVFVEWGDAIAALFPDEYLQVELTLPADEATRLVRLVGLGRGWLERWPSLSRLTAPWSTG